MTKKERLSAEAYAHGVDVIDWRFNSDRIKGLYCDGTIALSNRLSDTEGGSVLAEELGHHMMTAGNILDQSDAGNRQQELKARMWGYNRLIGLVGIVDAFNHGCRNRYEMADFLGVTESFLQDALDAYRKKYGCEVKIDNYLIRFVPHLDVVRML